MDSIFEAIGPFGRYQKLCLIIVGLVSALSAMSFYVTIFNVAEPAFKCSTIDDDMNNNNYESNNSSSSSNKLAFVNKCDQWYNKSQYKCHFEKTYYELTIVNEWELVCEKRYMSGLSQTVYLIGTISAFLSGSIGDKFGRKKATLVFVSLFAFTSITAQLLLTNYGSGVVLSIKARYIIYCVAQFFSGVFAFCMFSSSYVLLIELTTHHYHTLFSNLNIYFYIVGELFVLVAFYFSRNWQITSWLISIFSLALAIAIGICMPESPRWLYEAGCQKEANRVLFRIAKFNKKKLLYDEDVEKEEEIEEMVETLNDLNEHEAFDKQINYYLGTTDLNKHAKKDEEEDEDAQNKRLSVLTIFKLMFFPMSNFLKLIALTFIWNCVTINYYGVTMGMTTVLQIDPYIMYLLSAAFEVIGISICHFNDILGRKKALLIYLTLATVSSLLISALPDDEQGQFRISSLQSVTKAVLALLGRMMMSSAFNTTYTFTAELYETRVRSTVVLFLNCVGCLGTLLSPQINQLRHLVWRPAPYIIYSSFTFLGCVILCFLPETYQQSNSSKKKKQQQQQHSS